MKLNEFVKNLKYKSIQLEICEEDGFPVWAGTLGCFDYWINKNKYSEQVIDFIRPAQLCNGFIVFLKDGE